MDKCKCKICNKIFNYGDKYSPMLNNEIWNNIVEYYQLTDYEKKANELFSKVKFGFCKNFKDKDEYHLYICSDCMENALGRKLLKTDLIGENIQFNKDFENKYFI